MVAPKGAVCVFECLSVNLALQEFFQAINFCFTNQSRERYQSISLTSILNGPREDMVNKLGSSDVLSCGPLSIYIMLYNKLSYACILIGSHL